MRVSLNVVFFLRAGALLLALGSIGAQAPPSPAPYAVLSAEGRRALSARLINGQEMFALDDLARLFDLTVREDRLAGGLTVTARTQTIVLTPGQSLASVGGRLISLPAPPVRDGRTWFVPVDFVPRALAPALGTPARAAQAVAADPRRRHPRPAHRGTRRSARRAWCG